MADILGKFERFIYKEIKKDPERAGKILAGVYKGIGFKSGKLPGKNKLVSREYLQSYTAGFMAKIVTDPSDSAIVNIFMPCEIFHALDIPVCVPEGLAAYIACSRADRALVEAAEDAGASDTLCSYHKVLTGAAETGLIKRPLMIANTTLACDANQLTFRRLAEKWNVPHCVIDVPFGADDAAVHYVADQLRETAKTAEECSGRKVSEEKLKQCIIRGNEAMKIYRKVLSKRGLVHFNESFSPELLTAINFKTYLGTEESLKYSKRLAWDVLHAPRHGQEKRVLWMHIMPNWQDDLLEIFQGADNRRVEVVSCDFSFSSLCVMDPEKPYESMAKRILEDSFNGPASRRIENALRMAKELKAEGAVIFCQWGCKQTQGLAYLAKEAFEENGIPALILDGDGADRMNGGGQQAVTRCRAFAEQLEGIVGGE